MSNPASLTGESLRIILIIMVGWSCFAFSDTTVKHLSDSISPAVILTFNGLLGSLALFIWILFDRGWKGFISPNWKWLLARTACIAATSGGIVHALPYIQLADLYGITFSAPFISVFLAWCLLKEQVGWHRWLAVTIGFIGVFILVGPKYNDLNIGLAFAAMAALAIALGTIVIRKIGKKEYLPLFILYPSMGIFFSGAPFALSELNLQEINPPALTEILQIIAISVFVMGGQLCTTYAISQAKATASIAPFVYIQVIWGVAFGYFIFGDKLTAPAMLGLCLIVSAGLYMIYREKQLSRQQTTIRR